MWWKQAQSRIWRALQAAIRGSRQRVGTMEGVGRWAQGAEVTRDNGGLRGVLCCAVECKLGMLAVVDGSGGSVLSRDWHLTACMYYGVV